MALEHTAERQPGDGQRGLHRVADELRQPEVPLAMAVRYAARVKEHEGPPLAEQRPEVLVDRVVELTAATPAAAYRALEGGSTVANLGAAFSSG